ncbi:HalOD1 output domain-containing protein [Halorussus lipolyticus]|uniref:HalOD1 output domain-containing protein n=1 Tax=Halorussus lipolyticus TaxID=3034024 RepID=UPI0023E84D63|nr:HalOD1 output domain-containing protein [Halorussus sp. DT80]
MSEEGGKTPPDADDFIVHRELFEGDEPDATDEPEIDIAKIVADLEGKEATDISSLYDTIDHVVEHLYSNPPPIEAQAELEFTYEGYRIELSQDGRATFMKIAD